MIPDQWAAGEFCTPISSVAGEAAVPGPLRRVNEWELVEAMVGVEEPKVRIKPAGVLPGTGAIGPIPYFIKSPSFVGSLEGYVFKLGDRGLGYYCDAGGGGCDLAVGSGSQHRAGAVRSGEGVQSAARVAEEESQANSLGEL